MGIYPINFTVILAPWCLCGWTDSIKVSYLIRLDARGQRRCSYETSYEIQPGRNSEQIERRTSNVQYWWRYALSILKQANRSLRRALRSWALGWKTQGRTTQPCRILNRSLRRALRSWALRSWARVWKTQGRTTLDWKTQGRTTPFGKLRAWACRKQPNRISNGRFALLSLFLNW
jgi:hypothetical protein